MLFFRFFVGFFFLISAAIAFDSEDWLEDRKAVSSIIKSYREAYLDQSLFLEKLKRSKSPLFTPELTEIQNAYNYSLNRWGAFHRQWDETPYDIDKIMKLLEFLSNERSLILNFVKKEQNDLVRFIYQDAYDIMGIVHRAAQQYYQDVRDCTRASLGLTADEEGMYRMLKNDYPGLQSYIKDKIKTEKMLFWLPSHQKKAEKYKDKIKVFESKLKEVNEKMAAQKQAIEPIDKTIEVKPRPTMSIPSTADQLHGAKEEKIEPVREQTTKISPQESNIKNKEKDMESNLFLEPINEELEYKDIEEIQEKLNQQYILDREKKRISKQNSDSYHSNGNSLNSPKENQETDEIEIRKHPTLMQIFSFDTNLKYLEFAGFLKTLKLKMEERPNGLGVWFNDKIFKVFHRPHNQGLVVPYFDLRIAKRALKSIDIIPLN